MTAIIIQSRMSAIEEFRVVAKQTSDMQQSHEQHDRRTVAANLLEKRR